MIDPHVHCRDGKQAYKETIAHVFEIAKEQGVEKIFEMPNTDPPILYEHDVQERLKLVPVDRLGDYYLYVGATADEKQLEGAVECYDKYTEVIGIKLHASNSRGILSVVEIEEQRRIYKILSALGYRGVIAVHCEKEDYLKEALWDPSAPITHSYARSEEAEIESVKDQIALVRETDFKGILHIVHVSSPGAVELIDKAKTGREMNVTCGVTPHHILWDNEMLAGQDGLLYRMNPPLREKKSIEKLREYLKEGKIDWIETDHAPHARSEKLFHPYLPGYPSLYLYGDFVNQFLPGIGISKEQIKKLTSDNIYEIFGNKIR